MPIIEIDEFPVLDSIEGTEIIHTKSLIGEDVTMTAQQVADLVPDPVLFDPTTAVTIPTENDKFVVLDDSEGGEEKNSTVSSVRDLLGVTTASGTLATTGHWDIGAFQIRWGTITSTTNSPEVFAYSTPFDTETYTVQINLQRADETAPIAASAFNATGFTIDRANGFGGNLTCDYFAIGR